MPEISSFQIQSEILTDILHTTPVSLQRVEIVERKGLGHPDTICDAINERICTDLCKVYQKRIRKKH